MAWTTAVSDLRTLLNDLPTDRYCYRKKVFGDLNGVNVSYKTFEFRRQTDFTDGTSSAAPLGVYLNGVRVLPSAVASDDIATGEFSLVTAPADGGVLQATYYYRWFEDTELDTFLVQASRWLQLGTDFTQIPDGLNQGALYYAAMLALQKMALRWTTRASNSFLLEDQPKKEALEVAKTYTDLAGTFSKDATKYRNDYYTKSGQSLAALSVSSFGHVSAVAPRR